jgi:hypothetical protein
MNKSALKRFFNDKDAMRAWAEFILQTMKDEANERVFKTGKSTESLKEAQAIIDKSFIKLAQMFTPKPKPRKTRRGV